jgi:hypothetical protein
MILRNKIYIGVFSFVFVFMLLWCPLLYVLDKTGVTDFEDLRNYKDPEKVYEEDEFLAGFLNAIELGKAEINNIYTNYLPLYNEIITASQKNERDMQTIFLDFLAEPPKDIPANLQVAENTAAPEAVDSNTDILIDAPEEPTEPPPIEVSARLLMDDNFHRYYTFEPYQFLDRFVLNPDDNLRRRFENQIAQITRIADTAENVNFYVYICTRMQDTEYSKEIVPQEYSTLDYFNEFIDTLNTVENIDGIGWLDIDTVEKRVEKVFRTDHHWAGKGAYSAYVDVINMMKEQTPDIGDPIPLNSESGLITFPDIQMRGSFAATLRFDEYYEDFSVLDITLPEYQTARMHTDSYERYAAGDADKGTFYDHYVNYYNSSNMRKYTLKNGNTGRNLLLIGDSYSWWYNWIIAAHFDNIYIYLPPWDRQNLNYDQYVIDNNITDVLIMQFSDRLFFNYYSDNSFNKVLRD